LGNRRTVFRDKSARVSEKGAGPDEVVEPIGAAAVHNTLQNRHPSSQVVQDVSWSVLSVQERTRSLFGSEGQRRWWGAMLGAILPLGRPTRALLRMCHEVVSLDVLEPSTRCWASPVAVGSHFGDPPFDPVLGAIFSPRGMGFGFLSHLDMQRFRLSSPTTTGWGCRAIDG
jgi:hypothetical protein